MNFWSIAPKVKKIPGLFRGRTQVFLKRFAPSKKKIFFGRVRKKFVPKSWGPQEKMTPIGDYFLGTPGVKQGQSRGRRIPFFCQLVPFWPYSFVRPNNPSDPLRSNGSLFAGGKEAFEGPEDLQRAPLGVPQRSAPKMGGTPIFGPPGVPRGAPRGGVPPPGGAQKGGYPPFGGD